MERTGYEVLDALRQGEQINADDLQMLRDTFKDNPQFRNIMKYAKFNNPHALNAEDPLMRKYESTLIDRKLMGKDSPYTFQDFRNQHGQDLVRLKDQAGNNSASARDVFFKRMQRPQYQPKTLDEYLNLKPPETMTTTTGKLPANPPPASKGFSYIQSDADFSSGWQPHGKPLNRVPGFSRYRGEGVVSPEQHGFSVNSANPNMMRKMGNYPIDMQYRELMSSQGINTENIGRKAALERFGTPAVGEASQELMGEANASFGRRLAQNRNIMPSGSPMIARQAANSPVAGIAQRAGASGAAAEVGVSGAASGGAAASQGALSGAARFASRALPVVSLAMIAAQLLANSKSRIENEKANKFSKRLVG